MSKREKGITLVAIIITVIIMLILAGVVLNLTIGENGLISTIKNASQEYENSKRKEEADLNQLYSEMKIATNDDAQITINIEDLNKIIQQQIDEKVKEEVDKKIEEFELKNNPKGIKENPLLMGATNSSLSANKTYTLNQFTIEKSEKFDDYFTLNEENGDLVCKVDGWYIINLGLSSNDSTSNTACRLNVSVNDFDISETNTFVTR